MSLEKLVLSGNPKIPWKSTVWCIPYMPWCIVCLNHFAMWLKVSQNVKPFCPICLLTRSLYILNMFWHIECGISTYYVSIHSSVLLVHYIILICPATFRKWGIPNVSWHKAVSSQIIIYISNEYSVLFVWLLKVIHKSINYTMNITNIDFVLTTFCTMMHNSIISIV